MSGHHGTMNGRPCWSPSVPQRWDDGWTVKEQDAPLSLSQAKRIVADAKRRGLIREPKPEEKPLTKAQLLASFPAAIEAAIKAGLVQRPVDAQPVDQPWRQYTNQATKICGCGVIIHILSKGCQKCRAAALPLVPCAFCGAEFRRKGRATCCSVSCANRLTGRRVAEAATPKPPQTCTVCEQQFPWRYTGTNSVAQNCAGECTREAARRRMTALRISQLAAKKKTK